MSQTRVFHRFAAPAPCRPVLAVFCLAAALVVVPSLRARPLAPDPVEEFRQVLRADKGLKDNPGGLKARRDQLTAHIEALTSLGDMARVLLLSGPREWRTEDLDEDLTPLVYKIDVDMREMLMSRFEKGVKRVIDHGTPAEQAAVAHLVSESAIKVRSLSTRRPFLPKRLAGLAADLLKLTRARSPGARGAAALALANVKGDTKDAVDALERLLADPSSQVRVDAARGLLTVAQLASEIAPVPETDVLPRPTTPTATPRPPGGKPPARVVVTPKADQLATFQMVVKAASAGMARSQPVEVRRLSVDAMRQITNTVEKWMILKRRDFNGGSPYPTLPLKDWSAEDSRNAREDRRRLNALKEDVAPLRQVFQKEAPVLARSIVDPDAAVRAQASRVVEELALIRDGLADLDRFVPTFKGAAKEEPEKKVEPGAPAGPALGETVRRSEPLQARADEPAIRQAEPAPAVTLGEPIRPSTPVAIRATLYGAPTRTAPAVAAVSRRVAYRLPDLPEELPEPAPAARTAELVESLRRELRSPDAASRLAALDALEVLGNSALEAIPDLARALCDGNKFVRWGAARALGKMKPRPSVVVPPLIHLLSDQDLDVRLSAINALKNYGPEARGAMTALALRINRGDPEARVAVMEALEAIGTDAAPALPAIAWAVILDPDPRARRTAAIVLGRFGKLARKAVPALNRALTDRDADVRRLASEALLKIEGR